MLVFRSGFQVEMLVSVRNLLQCEWMGRREEGKEIADLTGRRGVGSVDGANQ